MRSPESDGTKLRGRQRCHSGCSGALPLMMTMSKITNNDRDMKICDGKSGSCCWCEGLHETKGKKRVLSPQQVSIRQRFQKNKPSKSRHVSSSTTI